VDRDEQRPRISHRAHDVRFPDRAALRRDGDDLRDRARVLLSRQYPRVGAGAVGTLIPVRGRFARWNAITRARGGGVSAGRGTVGGAPRVLGVTRLRLVHLWMSA